MSVQPTSSGHEGSGCEGSGYEGSGYEGSGYEGSGYEGSGYEGPRYDWYQQLSDDQRADLRAAVALGWDQGLSVPELADLFQIADSRAYVLLGEAGVRFGSTKRCRPPDQTPVRVRQTSGPRVLDGSPLTEQQRIDLQQAAVQAWNLGRSVGEIADLLEISNSRTRELLKAAGITMQHRHRPRIR
jgi:hypothetical protein